MAKTEQSQTHDALQIDALQEADRPVVITPDDEDRFVKTCRWVVEASKLGLSRDVWLRELHAMLSRVQQFCLDQDKLVKFCFAAKRDEQIGIYFVSHEGRYDIDLEPRLTELDIELGQKFQACMCDVFQIPEPSAAERIFQLGPLAIIIHGDIERSQDEVVA